MNDLIARLEAATGPDRELDHFICNIMYGKQAWSSPTVDWCRLYNARPTASIDAALTLAPKGFQAYVDTGVGHGDAHACVWTDHPHRIQGGARQQATPAIALCIAALKALAELQAAPIAGHQQGQTK